MILRVSLAAALLMLHGSLCAASGFTLEVKSPDVTVTLPDFIPSMKMAPHPMRMTRTHLRLLGHDGPYTVSVITPTADKGMGPRECAAATTSSLAGRPGVPPLKEVVKGRLNERTYIAMYGSRLPDGVQLHAHLFSAAGTHCIEVHVSKVASPDEDFDPWFKGWGKASIDAK